MSDFDEQAIARLLNDSVDAQLGPRRPAPPFQPERSTGTLARTRRRNAKPWIMPLVAAACVVAAAVGTIGASQALSHRHQASPPASQLPPPPVSDAAPTSPHAASSAPHSVSSASVSHPALGGGSDTSTNAVQLGGATLRLPAGWVARDYSQYQTVGSSTFYPTWCLTPASEPASTGQYSCPVKFSSFSAPASGEYMEVDNEGGLYGNPEYCFNGGVQASAVTSQDTTFGGRAADHRTWVFGCKIGARINVEQYLVATGPGYILFSERAVPAVSAAMAEIAKNASLPAQTSAVRFNDHGYIRNVQPISGGYRISVDRVVPASNGYVNNNPTTYDYVVPTAVYHDKSSAKPTVGKLMQIYTDGSEVVLLTDG